MFHRKQVKLLLVQLAASLIIWPCLYQSLIITSVIAGDKKFKTISFDSKFIKPLMFESELPTTEFRRHRTVRPPKFDIDVNIPIKLPLEDQYAPQEYKKPVVSDVSFETGEIVDKTYGKSYYNKGPPKKVTYPTTKIQFKESLQHAASSGQPILSAAPPPNIRVNSPDTRPDGGHIKPPTVASNVVVQRRMEPSIKRMASVEVPSNLNQQQQPMTDAMLPHENSDQMMRRNSYYGQQYKSGADYQQQPEFVPGGFVNLQLSGPTGGPKMTYEDFDREKWAQQLSQTAGAMPYPILNYHQLQNFYGGLGTFTNGLAESRYIEVGPLEKLKKIFSHFG